MNSMAVNPLGVVIGILIGVSGVIALIARLDRTGESRIFYNLLLTVVFVIGAAIVMGAATS